MFGGFEQYSSHAELSHREREKGKKKGLHELKNSFVTNMYYHVPVSLLVPNVGHCKLYLYL